MNFFLDTEFYEDGERIHLISIGIVCEDGTAIYAENNEFDWGIVPTDHWIQANVRPHITHIQPGGPMNGWTRAEIAGHIEEFVLRHADKSKPVIWAYFADYDWVVLCQLFGRMVDLPKGFPFFCMDLKQMMEHKGLDKEWKQKYCPDPAGEHNALVDAQWNMQLYRALMNPVIRYYQGTDPVVPEDYASLALQTTQRQLFDEMIEKRGAVVTVVAKQLLGHDSLSEQDHDRFRMVTGPGSVKFDDFIDLQNWTKTIELTFDGVLVGSFIEAMRDNRWTFTFQPDKKS